MAVNKIFATPNRLRYRADVAAGGGTFQKTRAEVIDDCAAGALRTFLKGLSTWNNADLNEPKLSVLVRYFGSTAPNANLALSFDSSPSELINFVGAATTAGMVALIDIVFNPTPVA
jgi:hypothetical protein